MAQRQFDFDLRVITPNGHTLRVPSELICMSRKHHAEFIRRRYRDNWATACMMYEIARHLNRYYRAIGK